LSNSETDGVVKSTLKFKRLRVKPAMTTITKQTATNNQKKSKIVNKNVYVLCSKKLIINHYSL